MANYQFTSDLIADILFRAGEPTTGVSDLNEQALVYVNRAYQTMYLGGGEISNDLNEDFWWAKKNPPGVLNLQPIITLASTATNGSAAVTIPATSPSLVGRFARIQGQSDIYRVLAHADGATALTLDAPYNGPAIAPGNIDFMQLEYDLPADCIRILSPMRIDQGAETYIDGVELSSLERDYPVSQIQGGPPTQFAYVTESRIRFNKFGPLAGQSPNAIRIEFDYIYRPADLTTPGTAEEPIVPRHYRKVLADIALTYLFVDKNDDRAGTAGGLAKKGLAGMVAEQRSRMINYSRSTGLILPRSSRNKNRFPLRTESGFIIG